MYPLNAGVGGDVGVGIGDDNDVGVGVGVGDDNGVGALPVCRGCV